MTEHIRHTRALAQEHRATGYFGGGEAVNWLTSSVMVRRISDLTLEQWLKEFDSLLERNKKLERMETQTPSKKKSRKA
jgi:hypothetical protein